MLINFTFENFLTYKNNNSFSMVSLTQYDDKKINLLKKSGIFGSKGSGKTNFVNTISYFKNIVLNKKCEDIKNLIYDHKKPAIFSIAIQIGKDIYKYNIELNTKGILSEKLFYITDDENLIFENKNNLILPDIKNNNEHANKVFNWIKNNLNIITNDGYIKIKKENFNKFKNMTQLFYNKDFVLVNDETNLPYINDEELEENIIFIPSVNKFVLKEDNSIVVKKVLIKKHNNEYVDVNSIYKQYGDVLKTNIILTNLENENGQVYIVDDFGNDPYTTKWLNSIVFGENNQIIFTTNNVLLMKIYFEKEEIWITNNQDNFSSLYSVIEFNESYYDDELYLSFICGRMCNI